MIVVSDTSCLCYLALLEQESILHGLYGEVFVPPSVAAELAVGAAKHPEIQRLLDASGVSPALSQELDQGEAESIALYEQLHADLLVVDEKAARAVAARLGIRRIGLLGILVAARRADLLGGRLKPVLDQLLGLGFRAKPALIAHILKEAGE